MITIEQCRAARGLLAWTQQDIADASGLSKTAINNFEKGHSDIKIDSLRAIRLAFESARIEFLEQDGVRKQKDKSEIVTGEYALDELLDDIIDTLKKTGGEVLIFNAYGHLSQTIAQEKISHYHSKSKELGISERIINNADNAYDWGEEENSRTLKLDTPLATYTTFIYGTKCAILTGDKANIIITESSDISTGERKRFEALWNQARADYSAGTLPNEAQKA